MLTKDKINVYKRYRGDIDRWGRTGSEEELRIMSDSDWLLIDSLLQDIYLINNNLSSDSYTYNVEAKLNESCDCDETVKLIYTLDKKNNSSKTVNFFERVINIFRKNK